MNQLNRSVTWVNEIFAITLFEEDLPAAKKFYQENFELEPVFEDGNSCVFKIGATLINLLKTSAAKELVDPAEVGDPKIGARLVFTLHVEDVDATCAQLREHGVKLLNGPMDRPWGIHTASFMDPGGHIWELAK
jgi:lactoylglutathione lyase